MSSKKPDINPNNLIPETLIINSTIIRIPEQIARVTKSLCKIIVSNKISTGFLIKLFRGEDDFFCLMTNEHTITKHLIEKKEKISFYYDSGSKIKEICLNSDERLIKEFTYIMDATVIQIIPEDKIEKEYFLLPNIDYINNPEELINKEIEIPQYPNGILGYSNGKIKDIINNEIIHLASTQKGSSGSPLFLKDTNKVIEMHKGGIIIDENKSENFADLIGPIYNYFLNDTSNIIKYENGEYYKGDILNGKANGRGIYYYSKGKIKYEGDFINDKKEGNGILYYKNGNKEY